MRDLDDIQKAHDILAQLLMDEELLNYLALRPSERLMMRAAADALCWVLGHDHNQQFGDRMTRLYRRLADAGVPIERAEAKFRLDGKRAD